MAERILILYLITSTNVGGTEKALYELISRLNRNEYAIYVCSLKKPGASAQKIADESDGFYSLGLSEAGGLKAAVTFLPALLRLFRLTRRLKPHILHSFMFRANIMGRIAARMGGVPIVISSIRVIESDKQFKHLIDRLTSSLVDKYTAVTEAVRTFTITRTRINPEKIVTIYNGIDCTSAEKKDAPEFIVKNNTTKIALAGRFHEQKGHAILIEALKTIVPQAPEIMVYFFGEGPDENHIKRLVVEQGVADHVMFAGVVDNLRACLVHMDIVVLPSLWEGFPNVLLEAMAEARPVVASRLEGIDEIVDDGQTGILCSPGDARSLENALLQLTRDPKRAEEMGQAGRDRALEKFSIDKTVKANVTLYRELLAQKR